MIRPQAHAKELIRFGSVHWCPVLPHMPQSREEAMSDKDRLLYEQGRAAGISQHGDNVMLVIACTMLDFLAQTPVCWCIACEEHIP